MFNSNIHGGYILLCCLELVKHNRLGRELKVVYVMMDIPREVCYIRVFHVFMKTIVIENYASDNNEGVATKCLVCIVLIDFMNHHISFMKCRIMGLVK